MLKCKWGMDQILIFFFPYAIKILLLSNLIWPFPQLLSSVYELQHDIGLHCLSRPFWQATTVLSGH